MSIQKKYDYARIQEDHKAGMKPADIAKKNVCHISTVYQALKGLGAGEKGGKVDYSAVQLARNTGEKATDIMKRFGISSASFYTKTHPAGGKAPVIRSRQLLKPTPSPFTTKAPIANGHKPKLVDEIKANFRKMLDTAIKERNEVALELTTLDKLIVTLEKATK